MKKSVIQILAEKLLGIKYYANIINARGTLHSELCCFIFKTKEEARQHKLSLMANKSYQWVETVSFRSRIKHNYK